MEAFGTFGIGSTGAICCTNGVSAAIRVRVELHPHRIAFDLAKIDGNRHRQLPAVPLSRHLAKPNGRPVLLEVP